MNRPTPRPDQDSVLLDLARAFVVHDRVQLRMACGTGKTLVGRWYAESSGARTVLVLVPSLALLAQTLTEWRRAQGAPFEALIICSDPSTAEGAAERDAVEDGELVEPEWATARTVVTTDPVRAATILARGGPDRPQVVFSTYHSALVAAAAQARSGVVFDLVICDEAHRLAGNPGEQFRAVLEARTLVARQRLFMTATARIVTGEGTVSMDDPTVFGVLAHTVSFGEAISAGLLCDYQVLVVAEHDKAPGTSGAGSASVVLDAVDAHGVRRMLTFHGRVAKAKAFADALSGTRTAHGQVITAQHVHGGMRTADRIASLQWLGDRAAGGVRVVSNARVLTEGVDVPAVDAICFLDARSSVIDIIQAIGRVLRPCPGKRLGTIIVPISLPADGDDDTTLLLSRFGLLWSVLRGLRAHDQRFAQDLDTALGRYTRRGVGGYGTARIRYSLPADVDEDQLHLRVVQEVGDGWERYFALCAEWCELHPSRRLPTTTVHREHAVGVWAAKQRLAHARGVLPEERAQRLALLPGWFWERRDASWADTYAIVEAFGARVGTVADNPEEPSVYAGQRAAAPQRELLGGWLARQRQSYRDGTLSTGRVDLLEQLPGWDWCPIGDHDQAMVDALRQFVAFEGTADVPTTHVEDGLDLGRWVWDVRRRKLTGHLAPELEDEIWAGTPSRWLTGHRLRWQWDKAETQWRLGYTALRTYAQREGHANPVTTHTEVLTDISINLGQWVALQRHAHRHGRLEQGRAAALEAQPGWLWDGDVGGTRSFDAPLELPAHLQHGSAGARGRDCHCEPCVLAARTYAREWAAARRRSRNAGGVDPTRARRHLATLEHKLAVALAADTGGPARPGSGRVLIAAASGVPLGVVRGLAGSTLYEISDDHDGRIRATTAAMCLSHRTAAGSRGRGASTSSEKVDVAPTRELLQDLQARGFSLAWIGRELGYTGSLQVGPELITRRVATTVRDLASRVGDLQMPELTPRRPVPTLALLTRAATQEAS